MPLAREDFDSNLVSMAGEEEAIVDCQEGASAPSLREISKNATRDVHDGAEAEETADA
jgi:hypothetical protein